MLQTIWTAKIGTSICPGHSSFCAMGSAQFIYSNLGACPIFPLSFGPKIWHIIWHGTCGSITYSSVILSETSCCLRTLYLLIPPGLVHDSRILSHPKKIWRLIGYFTPKTKCFNILWERISDSKLSLLTTDDVCHISYTILFYNKCYFWSLFFISKFH